MLGTGLGPQGPLQLTLGAPPGTAQPCSISHAGGVSGSVKRVIFWVPWVPLQRWLGPQVAALAFLIASGGYYPFTPSPLETGPCPSAGRAPWTPPRPCCCPPLVPRSLSPRNSQEATRRPKTTTQVRVVGRGCGQSGGQQAGHCKTKERSGRGAELPVPRAPPNLSCPLLLLPQKSWGTRRLQWPKSPQVPTHLSLGPQTW